MKRSITHSVEEIADSLSLHPLVLFLRRSVIEMLAAITPLPECGPVETVMLRILETGPLDTDAIRGLTALDMVSFSKSIRRLERLDMVESFSGTHDKRRKLYALLPMGIEAARLATDAANRTQEELLQPLTPRDRQLFMRLLSKATIAHAVRGAVPQDPRIANLLGGHIDPGTLLRRALQITAQFFEEFRGNLPVSPLEAAAILCIANNEPLKAKELSKLLAIDRGSAHAIVTKLVNDCVLKASAYEKRVLELKASGHALSKNLAPVLLQVEAQFLDGLAPVERPRLMRVMRRLFVELAKKKLM